MQMDIWIENGNIFNDRLALQNFCFDMYVINHELLRYSLFSKQEYDKLELEWLIYYSV